MSEKLLLQYCPECRAGLDGALEVKGDEETKPKPGDISVCFYCGTILKWDKSGALVRATRADINELEPMQQFNLGLAVGGILKRNAERKGSE